MLLLHRRDLRHLGRQGRLLSERVLVTGALVANYPGVRASMSEVVAAIEAAAPEVAGRISFADAPLPFPAELEASALEGAGPDTRLGQDTAVVHGSHELVDAVMGA